jgi:hypothetical protein
MTDVELAYAAGIVDGEGYVGIKKAKIRPGCNTPGYHARIQIRMVDEAAIRFVSELLGGWYYQEKPHSDNGRPLFCFQASDQAAEQILAKLLPFLRVKKLNAETVLQLRELQHEGPKHRTKVTGYRNFPNKYGTARRVPNLSYSDEYVAQCEALYVRCKELNRGIR